MNVALEVIVRASSVLCVWRRSAANRVLLWANPLPDAGFPHSKTKVTVISVDTPGRDISSPKGSFVQWR
jgi:hypothetical protein